MSKSVDPLAEDNSIPTTASDEASVYTCVDGRAVVLSGVSTAELFTFAANEFAATIVSAAARWFAVGMLMVRGCRICSEIMKDFGAREYKSRVIEVQNRVQELTGASTADIRVRECVNAYLLRELVRQDAEFGEHADKITYLEYVLLASQRGGKTRKFRALEVELKGMHGTFRDQYRKLVREILDTRLDGYHAETNPRGKLTAGNFQDAVKAYDDALDAVSVDVVPPSQSDLDGKRLEAANAEKLLRRKAFNDAVTDILAKGDDPATSLADEILAQCQALKVKPFTVQEGVHPSTLTTAEAHQFALALRQRIVDEKRVKVEGESGFDVAVALRDYLSKVVDPIQQKRAERAAKTPAPALAGAA